jgi:homospermidine synthase
VIGLETEWTSLTGRPGLFPENFEPTDPWQLGNVLV